MSTRTRTTAQLGLAAAVAGLAVAVAGCAAAPSGATAGQPARSHLPVLTASASPGARASVPSRTGLAPGPASPSPAATPSVSARPAPSARRHGGAITLSAGVYVDAKEEAPHYVLSVARRPGSGAISGAVNYLYPGGATFVGQYTGTVTGRGRITVRFGGGKVLVGQVLPGGHGQSRLSLSGCSSVLPKAASAGGCDFTYNGEVSD